MPFFVFWMKGVHVFNTFAENVLAMKRLLILVLPFFVVIGCQRQSLQPLWNLTHTNSAQIWEDCFPLGNGHLGMMPDGGVERETIVGHHAEVAVAQRETILPDLGRIGVGEVP